MFFVCDGNHRRQAWLNHIDRLYRTDEDWHYLVDSIILDTKGKNGFVMQVMHNINKYVHSHFISNLSLKIQYDFTFFLTTII